MNHIIANPDIRKWMYRVAAAIGVVLIGYGIVTAEQGGLWLSLIGAVLGGPNGLASVNTPDPNSITITPGADSGYLDPDNGFRN